MPARIVQAPGSMSVPVSRGSFEREERQAAQVLIFTCEVCGDPAAFGEGANIREALRQHKPELAGKWYCRQHLPTDYLPRGTSHESAS